MQCTCSKSMSQRVDDVHHFFLTVKMSWLLFVMAPQIVWHLMWSWIKCSSCPQSCSWLQAHLWKRHTVQYDSPLHCLIRSSSIYRISRLSRAGQKMYSSTQKRLGFLWKIENQDILFEMEMPLWSLMRAGVRMTHASIVWYGLVFLAKRFFCDELWSALSVCCSSASWEPLPMVHKEPISQLLSSTVAVFPNQNVSIFT